VQEAYARWYAMSRQQQEAIESPGAWLTQTRTTSLRRAAPFAEMNECTAVGNKGMAGQQVDGGLKERIAWLVQPAGPRLGKGEIADLLAGLAIGCVLGGTERLPAGLAAFSCLVHLGRLRTGFSQDRGRFAAFVPSQSV